VKPRDVEMALFDRALKNVTTKIEETMMDVEMIASEHAVGMG